MKRTYVTITFESGEWGIYNDRIQYTTRGLKEYSSQITTIKIIN